MSPVAAGRSASPWLHPALRRGERVRCPPPQTPPPPQPRRPELTMAHLQTAASTVGREGAEEFLRELNARFSLVKVEQLQLLNLRPQSAVEVHRIVEDCEERLSEKQVQDILELSERLLSPEGSDMSS